jgi:hypothetical protein
MARIYTTLEGKLLDLSDLDAEEAAFFARCYNAFRENKDWAELSNLIAGAENPLVRDSGGWITDAVAAHPLFQAVEDLADRLGIRQGDVGPDPGDDLDHDPLTREPVVALEAT